MKNIVESKTGITSYAFGVITHDGRWLPDINYKQHDDCSCGRCQCAKSDLLHCLYVAHHKLAIQAVEPVDLVYALRIRIAFEESRKEKQNAR